MKLHGDSFGHALGASGVEGFFGEGYWFHRLPYPFGACFKEMTFVAKTTTIKPRAGNMSLSDTYTPNELKPQCICVYPLKGIALNAIGLSGPGAKALLEQGLWQKRTAPFMLSFATVENTKAKRLGEMLQFSQILMEHLPSFQAPIALQINFSCPNTKHRTEFVEEILGILDIASILKIPLVPKFSVTFPVTLAAKVSRHPHCDALCVTNTIPFGALPEKINWNKLFPNGSPLLKFGGGGLSGKPLMPLVEDWVKQAGKIGVKIPINAGGGILTFKDVISLKKAGASSVFFGSMAMLRPWRVQNIIKKTNVLFEKKY